MSNINAWVQLTADAACILILAAAAAPAWAAPPAVAVEYCAKCHEVWPGIAPRNKSAHAPSFIAIANDPQNRRPEFLAHVISQSHASMPPFALSAEERRSLIAYIQGFKAQPD